MHKDEENISLPMKGQTKLKKKIKLTQNKMYHLPRIFLKRMTALRIFGT